MTVSYRPRWQNYFIAVSVTAAMLAARLDFPIPFGNQPLLILFMFSVILSAALGGLGPGLVSTLLAALSAMYFLLPPTFSFAVANSLDIFQLIVFIVNGVLVSVLCEGLQRARRTAEANAERQALIAGKLRGDEAMLSILFNKAAFATSLSRLSDHMFVMVNDAWLALFGYAEEQVIGKTALEIGMAPDPAGRERMFTALEKGKSLRNQELVLVNAGVTLTLLANADIIEMNGQRYILSTVQDITDRKRAEALIWTQANFDVLTKLPNRHMFQDRLQQDIRQAGEAGTSVALMLIDLDEFKEVNDTLGHDRGDILLIEVARRIRSCVRESATVARLGGDEFTVILLEPEDVAYVQTIAKQIIASLAAPFLLGNEQVFVSASVGIVLFPEIGSGIDDLLRFADQAMYAAKNAGRDQYCYFTPALQQAAQLRMNLTKDLRSALAENQFEVFYQPIVELATGNIRKAEALLRWNHPTRGMVSPAEFIPLAEASGQILEIGEWVFKKSADQVQRMRTLGDATFQISVNISPVQFRSSNDLGNMWLNNLGTLGLPAQSMVIEITEGLLLDVSADVKRKLIAFGVAGIQVALDDFGTGYSSLAYLKKFDIDYLKIDRAFVSNLASDSDDRALCEAIIVMAHRLGLRVIAEGVETEAQRDLLSAAGCDFAQGYLFSKPVPVEQFEALLQ